MEDFIRKEIRKTRILGKRRGIVHVYTGNGGGKTSTALGRALRAVGHKQKVVIVQFLKAWKNTGEYKIAERLTPYYEIHLFGRKEYINLNNPGELDREMARKGLEFAGECLKKKPDLLILDEVNYACAYNILDTGEVVELIKTRAEKTSVILTGRYAPEELKRMADIVTEINDVKSKRCMRYTAQKGIEF